MLKRAEGDLITAVFLGCFYNSRNKASILVCTWEELGRMAMERLTLFLSLIDRTGIPAKLRIICNELQPKEASRGAHNYDDYLLPLLLILVIVVDNKGKSMATL